MQAAKMAPRRGKGDSTRISSMNSSICNYPQLAALTHTVEFSEGKGKGREKVPACAASYSHSLFSLSHSPSRLGSYIVSVTVDAGHRWSSLKERMRERKRKRQPVEERETADRLHHTTALHLPLGPIDSIALSPLILLVAESCWLVSLTHPLFPPPPPQFAPFASGFLLLLHSQSSLLVPSEQPRLSSLRLSLSQCVDCEQTKTTTFSGVCDHTHAVREKCDLQSHSFSFSLTAGSPTFAVNKRWQSSPHCSAHQPPVDE